jgi:N-acetylmuramoyl-L-alanine amidase
MKIVISSGHGLYVRGASGILDEVDEARLVVERVAKELRNRDIDVVVFHDDVSTTQNENLNRIVDFHNGQGPHDLDVSVHFNAYEQVSKAMGVEVLYITQQELAADVSLAIADCGLINRGSKKRTDLFFLNNTIAPAILIETCFVDSEADAAIYDDQFDNICDAIAGVIGGEQEGIDLPDRPARPTDDVLFHATGKCSYFGGPDDDGVSEQEGLAFFSSVNEDNQQLFLPINTGTGLARQLNPFVSYLACRWDYDITPKQMLAESGERALVRALATGREALAFPADWGPNEATDRVADLSPGLCEILGVETDDEVEVIYPWRE